MLREDKRVRYMELAEGETAWCRVMEMDAYWAQVRVEAGAVICADMDVEQWGECAVLRPVRGRVSACPVRQTIETVGGTTYTVTAVCERSQTSVWVDGADSRLYMLPRGKDVELTVSAALTAVAVAVKREEQCYLVLVSLYEDAVLYEGWVDAYSLGDRLTVDCTFDDMKRHARHRVFGYKEGRFDLLVQSFTCAYAHAYIPTLVPYLFAEALLVGDREEAQSYLVDDLRADFEALCDYIGEVTFVRRPPIPCAPCDVGIVDAKGHGKTFAFELDEDKIADVRLIE